MKVTAAVPSLLMFVLVCGAVAAGCTGTSRIVLPDDHRSADGPCRPFRAPNDGAGS